MEPDVLRLILLAFGAIMVVSIYIWDRYKRNRWRASKTNAAQQRKQPVFDQQPVDDDTAEVVVDMHEPEPEPLVLSEHDTVLAVDVEPEGMLDLNFHTFPENDYVHGDPALLDDLPTMVLQINLQSRGAAFHGEQIIKAMKEVGLYFGDMDIYHRFMDENNGAVLFSVASMIEPGTFPIDKMGEFRSRGLVLFSQLPGVQDGMAIYSDMLFTAERLASILDGKLQDDSHSVLSKQTIEHTREQILNYRSRLQLARKKQ